MHLAEHWDSKAGTEQRCRDRPNPFHGAKDSGEGSISFSCRRMRLAVRVTPEHQAHPLSYSPVLASGGWAL